MVADPDRPANREYGPTPDDEVGRIAAGDQQRAAVIAVAANIHDYYQALMAAGFSRAEALYLTIEYQKGLITGAQQKPPDAT